jgi:hypothetical protein
VWKDSTSLTLIARDGAHAFALPGAVGAAPRRGRAPAHRLSWHAASPAGDGLLLGGDDGWVTPARVGGGGGVARAAPFAPLELTAGGAPACARQLERWLLHFLPAVGAPSYFLDGGSACYSRNYTATAVYWMDAQSNYVHRRALDDTLEPGGRQRLVRGLRDDALQPVVDEGLEIVAQPVDVDAASLEDRSRILILGHRQKQVLQGRVFVTAFPGERERSVQGLLEVLGQHGHRTTLD